MLQEITFHFGDDPTFLGYTDSTTWNGFDNVWVTEDEHNRICNHFRSEYILMGEDAEGVEYLMQSFYELEPDDDGLYSYANGFATSADVGLY